MSLHLDLNRDQFEDALNAFNTESEGAELAMFFYSGHGMEVLDKTDYFNVLAPIDARIDCETRRASRFVQVEEVLRSTKGVPNQMLLFDACREIAFRNCPPRRDAAVSNSGYGFRAFVPDVSQGEATLLVYSTGQKSLARDGERGKHSPFARVLLEHLRANAQTNFLPLLNRVVVEVGQLTNFKQVPSVVIEGGIPQTCLSGSNCSDERDERIADRLARSRALVHLSDRHRELGDNTVAALLALEGLDPLVRKLWPTGSGPSEYIQRAGRVRAWGLGTDQLPAGVDPILPTLLYKAVSTNRERGMIRPNSKGSLQALSRDGLKLFFVPDELEGRDCQP